MNPKQIAEEAWYNIATEYDLLSVRGETGIAIIQAAIEKATEEVRKERDAWNRVANWDESRAAHTDVEQLRAECDHYKMLTQELGQELRAAHASEKRHHYQAEDGFPCPCGKPIDHPIHIPRIEP